MKSMIRTLLLTTFSLFLFNACGTNSDQSGDEVVFVSAYVCPMDCEGSGSDQPGKCPVCKMDYVANPKYHTNNTSNSSEIFACPMHPDITGKMGDSCSICHMALVHHAKPRKAKAVDSIQEDDEDADFEGLDN